jgi:hypothetical protein
LSICSAAAPPPGNSGGTFFSKSGRAFSAWSNFPASTSDCVEK